MKLVITNAVTGLCSEWCMGYVHWTAHAVLVQEVSEGVFHHSTGSLVLKKNYKATFNRTEGKPFKGRAQRQENLESEQRAKRPCQMRLSGGNCILFDSASIFPTTWSVEGAWLSSQPVKEKRCFATRPGSFERHAAKQTLSATGS